MTESVLYRLRMMIVEANRFRGLLMDRELTRRYASAVLARFSNTKDTLRELRSNTYDVAVVDFETVTERTEEFLFGIRETNPNIVLVGFGPSDISTAQRRAAELWADEYIVNDAGVYAAIASVIDRHAQRWTHTPTDPNDESILDARTRSTIISTTVRTLAHEINNPLMTILGTTELLMNQRYRVDPGIQEKIRMIHESADRIQTTLSELANLSGDVLRGSPVGPLLTPRKPIKT